MTEAPQRMADNLKKSAGKKIVLERVAYVKLTKTTTLRAELVNVQNGRAFVKYNISLPPKRNGDRKFIIYDHREETVSLIREMQEQKKYLSSKIAWSPAIFPSIGTVSIVKEGDTCHINIYDASDASLFPTLELREISKKNTGKKSLSSRGNPIWKMVYIGQRDITGITLDDILDPSRSLSFFHKKRQKKKP